MSLWINNKQWFYKLKPTTEGPKNSLMDVYGKILSKKLIVCFVPGVFPGTKKELKNQKGQYSKLFSFFDNYISCYKYIITIPAINRSFFEVILPKAQKPHFDIDVDLKDLHLDKIDAINAADGIKDIVIFCCIEVLKTIGIDINIKEDVLIFTSHGSEKNSYHIVIDNYYHADNDEAFGLYQRVIDFIKKSEYEHVIKYIDPAVYSKKQQFRMFGSQKYGSGRIKMFCEKFNYLGHEYEHIYPEDVSDHEQKLLTIFYSSLITFVNCCKPIKMLSKPVIKTYKITGDLSESEVEYCLQLVNKEIAPCFTLHEVIGSIISLFRAGVYYCPICKREHPGTENAFLWIVDGEVNFNCRRKKYKYHKLGNIDIDQLVEEFDSDIDDELFEHGSWQIGGHVLEKMDDVKPVNVRNKLASVMKSNKS